MPACKNCGGFVTEGYVRVFAPETDADSVRVCPNCEDKVRDGREVREARSTRHTNGTSATEFDPEYARGEADD